MLLIRNSMFVQVDCGTLEWQFMKFIHTATVDFIDISSNSAAYSVELLC